VTSRARLRLILLLLAISAVPWVALRGQQSATNLPQVTEHATVGYPPLARQARIQGNVRLQVTTDGHVVTGVVVEEGHPLLAQAATQNISTWKFEDHVPGTFEVTFNFRILSDTVKFLEQPGIVDVVESPEGGISTYTLPERWNAQVRNSQGTIDTQLTLWTYKTFESEIDGYVTGPQGRERPIRNSHIRGNMLGFDAELEDKYGQRLKFSMIGRMTGDKINGVFLNYWGAGGTWTATRAPKPVPGTNTEQSGNAQGMPITSPDIAYHDPAEYPRFAIDAGIEGEARLRAKSDGHRVADISTLSGNPFLARAAASNLMTWRFANHMAQTFDVTYSYRLLASEERFLKQPGLVEIDGVAPLINIDNFGYPYDPPSLWNAQLKCPRGDMSAVLSLATSYDMPDGFVLDPSGKKDEISEAHQDGDMLGFDATVHGPDGAPLSVSLLGKKRKNKITGVFLDYSGTAGTWTAVRQLSHAKPAR
jgi:outer membrane biosynthesis protein TonB